jgi:hypothetical protein
VEPEPSAATATTTGSVAITIQVFKNTSTIPMRLFLLQLTLMAKELGNIQTEGIPTVFPAWIASAFYLGAP